MIAFLESVFVKGLLLLLQALPWTPLMCVARCVARLAWRLDPIHRRTVLDNLAIAFGDDSSCPDGNHGRRQTSPLRAIARESFARVAQNAFAAAWLAARDDQTAQKLLEISGVEENLLPAIRENRGVIVVMFHLGNWEILSRIASRIPQVKFSTIYQPLKNSRLNALLAQWRGRGGVALINRHHGFAEAVRRLRRGEAVGMLVDQHAGDHGMWVPFFNRLASTTPLPALLSRRTGAAILPLFCLRTDPDKSSSRTQWRVEFGAPVVPAGRSDGEIMTEIHGRLEAVIRQDPPNWFWFHQRWKTPSPDILFRSYRRGFHVPANARLQPFRILVRSANWLGDAVLALPALRAIHDGRPDCHITLLAPPKLAGLWRGRPGVDEVVTSLDELRHRPRFHAAVLFPNSLRAALEAWRLRIPRRFGYAGHWRRALLTAVCPESHRSGLREHEVKDFCGLVRWLGGVVESEIPSLDWISTFSSHTRGVSDGVASHAPQSEPSSAAPRSALCVSRSYVVLHPGAAHGSAKRWLPERFIELVACFPDVRWLLVGSAEERGRNGRLAARMDRHVRDLTGQLSLHDLAETLAGARAVVCNDSGPMHLAAAVGAPIVAIFGSTEPLHTGPLTRPGQPVRVLRHLVECSPCYLKECPIDLRCMKGVTVAAVAAALREILAR